MGEKEPKRVGIHFGRVIFMKGKLLVKVQHGEFWMDKGGRMQYIGYFFRSKFLLYFAVRYEVKDEFVIDPVKVFVGKHVFVSAVLTIPYGYSMPPPYLARYAPISEVFHPL